jgi:nucleotide-binding universal stress UspA family protein
MLWMLDALAPPLRDAGLEVELETTPGPGCSVLLDAARKLEADLIVVGSQGSGAASAANTPPVLDLVERAHCPVLVARAPRVTRILLAMDDSPSARAMPGILCRWEAFADIPIDVVSVIPFSTAVTDFVTPWAPITSHDSFEHAFERHHDVTKDAVLRLVSAGRTAQAAVLAGLPAHEIVEAADVHGTDLIVIASRGRDGRRRRIGSVAREILIRSHASVLVMRKGGLEARRRTQVARTDTALVGA